MGTVSEVRGQAAEGSGRHRASAWQACVRLSRVTLQLDTGELQHRLSGLQLDSSGMETQHWSVHIGKLSSKLFEAMVPISYTHTV